MPRHTMEISQEEVIRRGLRAAQVLSNDDLMGFIKAYQDDCLTCIANTATHESKTRESNYYQHYALREVLDTLQSYVDVANQIIEAEDTRQRELRGDEAEHKDTD